MTTISSTSAPRSATRRPTSLPYWIAAALALVGLVAGCAIAWNAFRDGQRRLDGFDRVAIPGAMSVDVGEPSGLVVYYEGDEHVRLGDLVLTVTGPAGDAVAVHRYDGELVYETLDLTKGTAIATFDASKAGIYDVSVRGVDTGKLVVGDSFARETLPGVLGGLAIAAAAVFGAFLFGLLTFANRYSRQRGDR